MSFDYDLFVIGSGSGGTRAARFASNIYGKKTAIIEMPFNFVSSDTEGGAGGTCVIRGCVPKKLFVYASHFSEEFEDAIEYGWPVKSEAHKWNTLLENKNKEVVRLNKIYLKLLENAGVDVYEGHGEIIDKNNIKLKLSNGTEKTVSTEYILISTGSKAVKLDIPGKELAITSDEALTLESLDTSKTIIIIGAGYIAVEFAGIFQGLGAKVHLVYRSNLPLRGFDEECRQRVADNLESRHINLHMNTIPISIIKNNDDETLTLNCKSKDKGDFTLSGNVVMFATGRKPYFKSLGIENVGITIENNAIKVNELSQTSIPNIYAVGDVTDRMNLTPIAIHEAMAFCKTLFTEHQTKPDYEYVPSAVFCQPPLGTVGYSENESMERFKGDLDIYVSDFKAMKNTISGRKEKILMKLIVHRSTNKVVGVHMVGPDSAEIIQGLAVALKSGATKKHFDSTIGIHPTAAEEFVTMRAVTRSVVGKGEIIP